MNVLIVFGSKAGGTKGLADMIGAELAGRGHAVTVSDAAKAAVGQDVQAVIVAGALYSGSWHGDAVVFVRKNRELLSGLPTWLVSSGPLDGKADLGALPPTPVVAKLAAEIGARGTETFGGVLDENAKGFIAKSMVKHGKGGDFRSPEHVAAWVGQIESVLR